MEEEILSLIEKQGDLLLKLFFSVIVLIIAIALARFSRQAVRRLDDSIEAIDLSKHARGIIAQMIKYGIYAVAIGIILSIFGMTEALYTLLTGGAILGFAIGYASKDVISNMLSGVIIAVDKPFKLGDDVELSGIRGVVKEIALRTTRLTTPEGVFVEIPNSIIIKKPVKNYSRK